MLKLIHIQKSRKTAFSRGFSAFSQVKIGGGNTRVHTFMVYKYSEFIRRTTLNYNFPVILDVTLTYRWSRGKVPVGD